MSKRTGLVLVSGFFFSLFLVETAFSAQLTKSMDEMLKKLKLMRREFVPFADEILGKEEAFRDPGLETQLLPKVFEVWNQLWLRGGGTAR